MGSWTTGFTPAEVAQTGLPRAAGPACEAAAAAVATTLVLLIIGVSAFLLGSQLLPSFKERDFLMHWLTVPGTSVGEETRISVSACQDLRQIPGVRNCGSHIGQALLADEVYGVDFGRTGSASAPTSTTTRPWMK